MNVNQQPTGADRVQAPYFVAATRPRNIRAVVDAIENAFSINRLAETACYQYQDGTGPSIRAMEALAQCYKNMDFGFEILDTYEGPDTVKVSHVRAYAVDLESNVTRSNVFQVRHWVETEYTAFEPRTSTAIYECIASEAQRRVRACLMAVIPGYLIDKAIAQSEATMKAQTDITPDGIRRLLESFALLGVSRKQIEARIKGRMEDITQAQVMNLKRVFVSLRDRMTSIGDWFQEDAPQQSEKAGDTANGQSEGGTTSPAPSNAQSEPQGTPAPTENSLPELTEDKLNSMVEMVRKGADAQRMISMCKTKYLLTAEQENKMKGAESEH